MRRCTVIDGVYTPAGVSNLAVRAGAAGSKTLADRGHLADCERLADRGGMDRREIGEGPWPCRNQATGFAIISGGGSRSARP